jgi:hemoglobin-like flavoprotein
MSAPSESATTEYIFDVTSDRKTTFAVSVLLTEDAVSQWAASHKRTLTDAEQYGAVKMRLFKAFDEVENMLTDGRRLIINAQILEQLLAALGID